MDKKSQQPKNPADKKIRRRRKEARPGEIIEAGLQEFAERGFASARIEDVAARAGIAKGTVYRYFENKEALFEAAVRSRVIPIFDQLTIMIDTYPGTAEELLRILFKTIYQKLITPDVRILMRLIIAEGARFPQITEFYYQEAISKGQKILRKIVERGIENGEFRQGPVSAEPMVLVAPGIMAAIWKMTFDAHYPLDLNRFLEAHIDLVFNGLKQS